MLKLHRDTKFVRREPGRDGKILSDHRQDGNVEAHRLYVAPRMPLWCIAERYSELRSLKILRGCGGVHLMRSLVRYSALCFVFCGIRRFAERSYHALRPFLFLCCAVQCFAVRC